MSNSTERVAAAMVYREAALLVEACAEHWSCNALGRLGADSENYEKLFMPSADEANRFCPIEGGGKWTSENMILGSSWGSFWADSYAEQRDCRVVALCFMAAMVEAGDA